MSIDEYRYKTFTYIAGDWTGDKAAIDKLHEWNEGRKWGLTFKDVHSETQSSDSSLNCSIKASLRKRMKICKKFVLVVGSDTDSLRSGACYNCCFYNRPTLYTPRPTCSLNHCIDNRSYIQYECDMAKYDYDNDDIEIVVLYNSVNVNRNLCPEPLRWIGTHAPMKKKVTDFYGFTHYDWDYESVKNAIG